MPRFTFPKSDRLLTNSQFKAVLSRRLTARDEVLVLYARENGLDYARLGISISKSCLNAVLRNRIKRLLREAFRQNRHLIPAGFDYVVMEALGRGRNGRDKANVKTEAGALKFAQIRDSLLTLASRLASKRA
jgi:ribonuclease P protein component